METRGQLVVSVHSPNVPGVRPLLTRLSCWPHLAISGGDSVQKPEPVGMVGTVTSQTDSPGSLYPVGTSAKRNSERKKKEVEGIFIY